MDDILKEFLDKSEVSRLAFNLRKYETNSYNDRMKIRAMLLSVAKLFKENQHMIRFGEDGWIIEHPFSERLDGTLLDCPLVGPDFDPGIRGVYPIDTDGKWHVKRTSVVLPVGTDVREE